MRAGCSASTLILVAAWEQSLHPGSSGNRLAHRKGQLNADNAVRTTGLLTAGRNPGGLNGPRPPTVDDRRQQRSFRRVITLPSAGLWIRPSPPRGCFCLNVHNDHWRETPHFRHWRKCLQATLVGRWRKMYRDSRQCGQWVPGMGHDNGGAASEPPMSGLNASAEPMNSWPTS